MKELIGFNGQENKRFTRSEVLALPFQHIDYLVAIHVMGWVVNRSGTRHWHTVNMKKRYLIGTSCCESTFSGGSFCPSQNLRGSHKVLSYKSEEAADIKILWTEDIDGWSVCLNGHEEVHEDFNMAVCLAALKEKGVLVGE